MMRLKAVVLERDERTVLTTLGKFGAVHLTRTRSGPDTRSTASIEHAGELSRCERLMARTDQLAHALEINSSPEVREPPPFAMDEAEAKLRIMEEKAGDVLSQRRRIFDRQKELAATSGRMSPYRGLQIPLDGLDRYSFLHFVTGSLPPQNLAALEKEAGGKVALVPLTREKDRQPILVMTTRQNRSELEKLLQQAGFERENLPVVRGSTVDNVSEEGEWEQEELTRALAQLNTEQAALAAEFALPLAEIACFLDAECRLLDAGQLFSRTDSTILFTGWVPAAEAPALNEHLKEATGGRYVMETALPATSAEERTPVLLKHSALLRPFEMLVSTYGLPDYDELEPTLFVALSYVLMFGMMFGDVGHGAVLAACGIWALMAGKSRKARDVGTLLLIGGSSSIVFGIVYGSYFGIEALKHYALWHDPLEGDPMQLMYGAIGLGIAVISIGLILNVINRFRRGDMIGAVLDKFGLVGLLFYWGAIVILMKAEAIRSTGLMTAAMILFFAVPIVGWSLKEPLEHIVHRHKGHGRHSSDGLGAAIAESCVGAFEAVLSYLANTISFVRLAAYAMSHAALLFAAFMLAEEVRKFPVGGGVFGIIVIILGNLVAIVLEGIIASVQALRLEYYEFFGKFFSGSGQPFEPFSLTGDRGSERRPGG
jgi:V/A-type H+-transporting ATPase subunit I